MESDKQKNNQADELKNYFEVPGIDLDGKPRTFKIMLNDEEAKLYGKEGKAD